MSRPTRVTVVYALVLSTVPWQGATLPPPLCPANCTCTIPALPSNPLAQGWAGGALSVACGRNQSRDIEAGLRDIVAFWSDVDDLIIRDSPLTDLGHVTLCALRRVRFINVSDNALTELGNLGCLSHLQQFEASRNKLWRVTDATFSGAWRLSIIALRGNAIRDVTARAFLNLPSLTLVDLIDNRLASIGIWPLHLVVTSTNTPKIRLDYNQIAQFTNDLRWFYDCSMKAANGRLHMTHNNISHFSDVVKGWSVPDAAKVFCLFRDDTFKVEFNKNPFVCDCVDFEIYKYLQLTSSSTPSINGLQCYTPWFNRKIISIPLEEFVCDVTTDCPDGCTCVQHTANVTFTVQCASAHLQQVPIAVPSHVIGFYKYHFRYSIDFSGNDLRAAAVRAYYNTTYRGDFSNNAITSLPVETIASMTSMSYMYLHGNRLTALPEDVVNVTFPKLRGLSLYGNPWSCECSQQWFRAWLLSLGNRLVRGGSILCHSPTRLQGLSLLDMSPESFCADPARQQRQQLVIISVASAAGALLAVLAPLAVAYKWRVGMYARLHLHPFDKDECEGEGKEFDVFVSYAEPDELWALELIHRLEAQGFAVFFHRRHFRPGWGINQNVARAVEASKRTLCVVTPNYVRSAPCEWEFETIYNLDIEMRKRRLVVVYKGPMESALLDEHLTISLYLRSFTYLEPGREDFWDRLLYALPVQRLGHPEGEGEGERTPLLRPP